MQDGMTLDPNTLINVQQNFIASARIKEVQLEAAVQQLAQENQQLKSEVERLTAHDQEATQEG